jgi:phosphoglycolate phosphatase-like HAD superfamily hydrolase
MSVHPLLVFDFDGVIVDGMAEYWWSAWHASRFLHATPAGLHPEHVPEVFRRLRPWVHHGWEMVLLAAEAAQLDPADWMLDYSRQQRQALERRGWRPESLQGALDQVRREAVSSNRSAWLALHRPYPGLVDRLLRLKHENADWAVLTTKSASFTADLLAGFGLHPWRLYGREAGVKPDVLLRLQAERPLHAFIEDRRATLEAVLSTPGLETLPCFLVSWGYLRPMDRQDLPKGLRLLDPALLASPLAQWP